MILDVNTTKVELLKLKKKLTLAKKGHKILKNKHSELIRNFVEVVDQYKVLREDIEKDFDIYCRNIVDTYSFHPKEILEDVLSFSNSKISICDKNIPIMNLRVPRQEIAESGSFFASGLYSSPADFDNALHRLSELTKKVIKLGEIEITITKLSIEIEKTKRRVNTLESILIPNLEETIKYIGTKISGVKQTEISRIAGMEENTRTY